MNFFVHQNIVIHHLRIDGITNSSVCQIGSAGVIKPLSQMYNTGGFTEPAPPPHRPAARDFVRGIHSACAFGSAFALVGFMFDEEGWSSCTWVPK
ncbi:spore germination protein GerPB [Brevibacillus gelatini]